MIVYNDLVKAKAQASAFEVPMFEGVNDGAIDVSDVNARGWLPFDDATYREWRATY